MWIELIVAVCLHSDPAVCRELNFQFVEEKSLNACMTRAQPYMAGWAGEHPKWRIVRWHCAYYDGNEEQI